MSLNQNQPMMNGEQGKEVRGLETRAGLYVREKKKGDREDSWWLRPLAHGNCPVMCLVRKIFSFWLL
ncbi:hypothetical protein BDA96_01G013300 [Sorghum bicolor]|uniref:Uncharacterized protein n=1 Tax=Sorghum bicolor TaxID=4558 RepID=A0A921UX42_SORBI|nr:hypothetical protein BDA96_01G013300 [Sorghum bicolor]